MMRQVKAQARVRQRGWSLLEAVLVVSLVAFMAAGFWKTLALVDHHGRSEQARDLLQRAEDALYGMALRDHQLPVPDDAVVSAQLPDHWEGWLPVQVLGTVRARSIRYVVDRSLTAAPPARYLADPLHLLGTQVEARADLNGLDLCLQAVRREETGLAEAHALRLAFGVQRVEAADRTMDTRFRLQAHAAEAQQTDGHVDTRAASAGELVQRLGCVQAFARLATAVKTAVLAADVLQLSQLDASLRALAVKEAEEAVLNHDWRIVNCSARLAVSTWNFVASKLTAATTPAGAMMAFVNFAGFALEASRWAIQLDYASGQKQKADIGLEKARRMLAAAEARVADGGAQFGRRLEQVNALQRQGVWP